VGGSRLLPLTVGDCLDAPVPAHEVAVLDKARDLALPEAIGLARGASPFRWTKLPPPSAWRAFGLKVPAPSSTIQWLIPRPVPGSCSAQPA
jgi:hypothetical protein